MGGLDLHFNLISGMDGPLLGWGLFLERVRNLWQLRRANGPVAPARREVPEPGAMSSEIVALVKAIGGDCIVGVAPITEHAVMAGERVPYTYAICIGLPMKREIMVDVPEPITGWEVLSADPTRDANRRRTLRADSRDGLAREGLRRYEDG